MSKVFTWPVQGTILRDYSVETLSLDPTLGDWRTHGGLDIAAAQGLYRSFQVISGIHRLAVQGGFQMDVGVHAHLGQSLW